RRPGRAERAGAGGGPGNVRSPGGVREPSRAAVDGAERSARDQATASRAGRKPGPRPARALVAPFVRHAPARRGRGPAGGAGAPRTRLTVYHADVYSYVSGTIEAGVSPGAPTRLVLTPCPPLLKGEGDRG